MNRRHFLRAAGVTLALPWLEAQGVAAAPRRRLVCLCAPLGLHPAYFFPERAGRDYGSTPYLDVLKDFRNDFTVVSGLSHAGNNPGFAHQASASFLTGAPGAGRPGFKNEISLDQLAAEHLGGETRIPSLVLSGDGGGLSWTRTGAPVPAASSPSRVFARLFQADTPEEARAQERRLNDGRGVLDDVGDQAKALRAGLGSDDRGKLDEYIASVRDLEKRLTRDEAWFKKPKPKVAAAPPKDVSSAADLIGRTKLLFDLAHLALETDSTRIITIMLGGGTGAPPIQGVTLGHHDLSHHGKDAGKLEQLKIVEMETMKTLRDFLGKLRGSKEEGTSLLDRTSVFLGSNLGDGSSHSVKNLPVLVAGGGFKHGQHLAFDPKNPPPLCNLYVSLLQGLGLPIDRFSNSTGTLTGVLTK
jgi:hypothetical protein